MIYTQIKKKKEAPEQSWFKHKLTCPASLFSAESSSPSLCHVRSEWWLIRRFHVCRLARLFWKLHCYRVVKWRIRKCFWVRKKKQACGVCGFPDCVIWVICDPCFKNKGETPGWKPLFLCVAPSLSLSLSLSDNRSLVFLPLSVPFFMPLITFITSVSHHVLVSRGGN